MVNSHIKSKASAHRKTRRVNAGYFKQLRSQAWYPSIIRFFTYHFSAHSGKAPSCCCWDGDFPRIYGNQLSHPFGPDDEIPPLPQETLFTHCALLALLSLPVVR